MAQAIGDRILETSTTTGTGTLTLGGAVTGYKSFSSICANGDTVYYCITDNSSLWEVGTGTYNTSNLLVRSAGSVLSGSSGAGVLVNFAVGAKSVFNTLPATAPIYMPSGGIGAPSYSFTQAPRAGIYWDPTGTGYLETKGADAAVGSTDTGGGNLEVAAGRGTGLGAGGSIYLTVAPPRASTGTTYGSPASIATFQGLDGSVQIGGLNINGTPAASSFSGANRATGQVDGAGANLTISGGRGTGLGAGGDLAFVAYPAGAGSGSAQNASYTPLTLKGTVGAFQWDRTITAGGTTGAQTINKQMGTVNFAAAATTLVVTNSFVSVTSLIFCQIRTADATAKSCVVVAGSGSFTITLNAAATAETSVGFYVTN